MLWQALQYKSDTYGVVMITKGRLVWLALLLLGGCCRVGSFDLVAVRAVLSAVAGWGCYRVSRNELVAAAVTWAAIG